MALLSKHHFWIRDVLFSLENSARGESSGLKSGFQAWVITHASSCNNVPVYISLLLMVNIMGQKCASSKEAHLGLEPFSTEP